MSSSAFLTKSSVHCSNRKRIDTFCELLCYDSVTLSLTAAEVHNEEGIAPALVAHFREILDIDAGSLPLLAQDHGLEPSHITNALKQPHAEHTESLNDLCFCCYRREAKTLCDLCQVRYLELEIPRPPMKASRRSAFGAPVPRSSRWRHMDEAQKESEIAKQRQWLAKRLARMSEADKDALKQRRKETKAAWWDRKTDAEKKAAKKKQKEKATKRWEAMTETEKAAKKQRSLEASNRMRMGWTTAQKEAHLERRRQWRARKWAGLTKEEKALARKHKREAYQRARM